MINRGEATKNRHKSDDFGGQGWIRTIEVVDDGFTVRCIWPLCNLPINFKHLEKGAYLELVNGIEPSTC